MINLTRFLSSQGWEEDKPDQIPPPRGGRRINLTRFLSP